MIRINLLRRRTPSYSSAQKPGGGAGLGSMFKSGADGFGKKLVPILTVFGIPLALGFAASMALDHYVELRSADMKQEEKALEDERERLALEAGKIKGFEAKRDEIEGNLRSIRGKMEAIERLIQNRDVSTRALTHLSQAIPSSAWITDLNFGETSYDIKGAAMEPTLVTDFVARLQKSIYFKGVQLGDTTALEENSDKVSFSLSGSP